MNTDSLHAAAEAQERAETAERQRDEALAVLGEIAKLHTPEKEEVEFWADDDDPSEHNRRFPKCGLVDACEGHAADIEVCSECGYTHDGDYAQFRHWPCPTARLLPTHQEAEHG